MLKQISNRNPHFTMKLLLSVVQMLLHPWKWGCLYEMAVIPKWRMLYTEPQYVLVLVVNAAEQTVPMGECREDFSG